MSLYYAMATTSMAILFICGSESYRLLTNDKGTPRHRMALGAFDFECKFSFAVETTEGVNLYGLIETSSDGKEVIIREGEAATKIPLANVERIDQYSPSFLKRINGNRRSVSLTPSRVRSPSAA